MKELSENDQPPLPSLTRLRRSQPTASFRWISPPLRAGRAGGGPANSGKIPNR
jgi:hypothetical protein